ncbi:MAG: hypothetical protein H8E20_00505 [Verrucomicrobia bacterium]|nr:hypothetical protein [Verrucomicrobiota bacterium]
MAGHVTEFEHDSMRRMTKRTDALLRQTEYEYCKCGALEKVTDALGQKGWIDAGIVELLLP